MDAKHTPGPWAVADNDGAYLKNADHATLRIEERSSPNEMVLALVVTDIDVLREKAKANARLIAAAPDLLAVLKDLLGGNGDLFWKEEKGRSVLECIGCGRDYTGDENLREHSDCPDDDCPRHRARTTIAKAEGR